MTDLDRLSAEQKREIGESLAKALVARCFREVFCRSTDDGIDVMCSGFYSPGQPPTPVLFQVKFGMSHLAGIRISPSTLRSLVTRADEQPVFFLHYLDPQDVVPHSFLAFHGWIVAHIEEVGNALESDGRLIIPHRDLQRLRSGKADSLWDACREEIGRVTGTSSSILVSRQPHFSGYHFYRYCQEVARNWDLALLCQNRKLQRFSPFPEQLIERFQRFWEGREGEPTVASILSMREYHPIARTSASVIRRAEGRVMTALVSYDERREFSLCDSFDVVQVAAARLVSSRYPRAVVPVLNVLRDWRNRSVPEVLVALQMASTLTLIDSPRKDALVRNIRAIVHDLERASIADLKHYRLLHHAYAVLGEIGQELSETRKAVEVAQANINLELRHLAAYGWGVGREVLTYYERALLRDTARNTVAHDYNEGMLRLMESVISPEK